MDMLKVIFGQGKTVQGATTLLTAAILHIARGRGWELDEVTLVAAVGSVWTSIGVIHKLVRSAKRA